MYVNETWSDPICNECSKSLHSPKGFSYPAQTFRKQDAADGKNYPPGGMIFISHLKLCRFASINIIISSFMFLSNADCKKILSLSASIFCRGSSWEGGAARDFVINLPSTKGETYHVVLKAVLHISSSSSSCSIFIPKSHRIVSHRSVSRQFLHRWSIHRQNHGKSHAPFSCH